MRSVTSSTRAPAKGCRPATISYSTTHNDQTSSACPAGWPESTSGDEYCGVPPARVASSVSRDRPKSSSFGEPSEVNPMLLGLMSRCR